MKFLTDTEQMLVRLAVPDDDWQTLTETRRYFDDGDILVFTDFGHYTNIEFKGITRDQFDLDSQNPRSLSFLGIQTQLGSLVGVWTGEQQYYAGGETRQYLVWYRSYKGCDARKIFTTKELRDQFLAQDQPFKSLSEWD